jgi:hypothetical protein
MLEANKRAATKFGIDTEYETMHMPFHYRLFGKDKYAMFSFIQSMNTTFGMSIWEQVAVILAKGIGNHAEKTI